MAAVLVGGCRDHGPETTTRSKRTATHSESAAAKTVGSKKTRRATAPVGERTTSVSQPDYRPVPQKPKRPQADEPRFVDGPEERYQVTLRDRHWHQVADQERMKELVHAPATVVWTGPDGCVGSLRVRQKTIGHFNELEPRAKEAMAQLPVEKPSTLWYEAKRYNMRPGYQWSASGVDKQDRSRTWRYRFAIGERDGWVFEVLAQSPQQFTTARWCHDRVFADVSF